MEATKPYIFGATHAIGWSQKETGCLITKSTTDKRPMNALRSKGKPDFADQTATLIYIVFLLGCIPGVRCDATSSNGWLARFST
jgi:hypothetical protein